jgi:hypothetical protein
MSTPTLRRAVTTSHANEQVTNNAYTAIGHNLASGRTTRLDSFSQSFDDTFLREIQKDLIGSKRPPTQNTGRTIRAVQAEHERRQKNRQLNKLKNSEKKTKDDEIIVNANNVDKILTIHRGNSRDLIDCKNAQMCSLPSFHLKNFDQLFFIFTCHALQKMDLHDNSLIHLPPAKSWESLPNLRILYLHKNRINSFEAINNLVSYIHTILTTVGTIARISILHYIV